MKTKQAAGPRPTGATDGQLEMNGLHWTLCGGLQVGMHTHPWTWRLRPKDEVARVAQRTEELQALATAARKVAGLQAEVRRLTGALERLRDYQSHQLWGYGAAETMTKIAAEALAPAPEQPEDYPP